MEGHSHASRMCLELRYEHVHALETYFKYLWKLFEAIPSYEGLQNVKNHLIVI
jgi:hypothetical protein